MDLVAWAGQLSAELGLGSLPLQTEGLCALRFEPGIEVGLELTPDRTALQLHAGLMPIPADPAGQTLLLETLLATNHAERGEASSLAADAVREEVVLWQRLTARTTGSYERFRETVAAFVARATALQAMLATHLEETVRPAADPETVDPFYLHAHFLRA